MGLSLILSLTSLNGSFAAPAAQQKKVNEVNLYTARHYDTDEKLYQLFTQETGIKVNVIQGNGDELMERIQREGKATSVSLISKRKGRGAITSRYSI